MHASVNCQFDKLAIDLLGLRFDKTGLHQVHLSKGNRPVMVFCILLFWVDECDNRSMRKLIGVLPTSSLLQMQKSWNRKKHKTGFKSCSKNFTLPVIWPSDIFWTPFDKENAENFNYGITLSLKLSSGTGCQLALLPDWEVIDSNFSVRFLLHGNCRSEKTLMDKK